MNFAYRVLVSNQTLGYLKIYQKENFNQLSNYLRDSILSHPSSNHVFFGFHSHSPTTT